MRQQAVGPNDVETSTDEVAGSRAVSLTSILSNLVAALFLALWGWSIAQDAAAVGAVPNEVYRVEQQIEQALWEIDRAGLGLVEDGVSGIRAGICYMPPEMSSLGDLDPVIVDGGFLTPAPPVPACAEQQDPGAGSS